MSNVTFLGMGAMGSRMATNLIEAGHDVTVWNRHPAKTEPLVASGAKAAPTPAEAALGAEFIIACVRDDDASREVWLDPSSGALAAMEKTAVAIESSTLTVGWARELAGHCRSAGIDFLDAPVAGSLPVAEAGQLIFLAGGEASTLERATPVLSAMGARIHHAGASGAGAAVKLMVNGLLGMQVAAIAELIGFAKRVGIDHERAVEIVTSTPVCSAAAKANAEGMMADRFTPLFPVELMEKDTRYVVASAGGDEHAPVTDAAREVYLRAIGHGLGKLNMTAVAKLYE